RARKLARDAHLDEPLVGRIGGGVDRGELVTGRLRDLVRDRLEGVRTRLADLGAHVLWGRHVKLVRRLRVAHAELVERTDAVPEPLARNKDRRPDVKAECVVLERGSVALAHEKTDEARVALF